MQESRQKYEALKSALTSDCESECEATSLIALTDTAQGVKNEECIGVINQSTQLLKGGIIATRSVSQMSAATWRDFSTIDRSCEASEDGRSADNNGNEYERSLMGYSIQMSKPIIEEMQSTLQRSTMRPSLSALTKLNQSREHVIRETPALGASASDATKFTDRDSLSNNGAALSRRIAQVQVCYDHYVHGLQVKWTENGSGAAAGGSRMNYYKSSTQQLLSKTLRVSGHRSGTSRRNSAMGDQNSSDSGSSNSGTGMNTSNGGPSSSSAISMDGLISGSQHFSSRFSSKNVDLLVLGNTEYITGVSGHFTSQYITQLIFTTNFGRVKKFGSSNNGEFFELALPGSKAWITGHGDEDETCEVIGFSGSYSGQLYNIAALWRPCLKQREISYLMPVLMKRVRMLSNVTMHIDSLFTAMKQLREKPDCELLEICTKRDVSSILSHYLKNKQQRSQYSSTQAAGSSISSKFQMRKDNHIHSSQNSSSMNMINSSSSSTTTNTSNNSNVPLSNHLELENLSNEITRNGSIKNSKNFGRNGQKATPDKIVKTFTLQLQLMLVKAVSPMIPSLVPQVLNMLALLLEDANVSSSGGSSGSNSVAVGGAALSKSEDDAYRDLMDFMRALVHDTSASSHRSAAVVTRGMEEHTAHMAAQLTVDSAYHDEWIRVMIAVALARGSLTDMVAIVRMILNNGLLLRKQYYCRKIICKLHDYTVGLINEAKLDCDRNKNGSSSSNSTNNNNKNNHKKDGFMDELVRARMFGSVSDDCESSAPRILDSQGFAYLTLSKDFTGDETVYFSDSGSSDQDFADHHSDDGEEDDSASDEPTNQESLESQSGISGQPSFPTPSGMSFLSSVQSESDAASSSVARVRNQQQQQKQDRDSGSVSSKSISGLSLCSVILAELVLIGRSKLGNPKWAFNKQTAAQPLHADLSAETLSMLCDIIAMSLSLVSAPNSSVSAPDLCAQTRRFGTMILAQGLALLRHQLTLLDSINFDKRYLPLILSKKNLITPMKMLLFRIIRDQSMSIPLEIQRLATATLISGHKLLFQNGMEEMLYFLHLVRVSISDNQHNEHSLVMKDIDKLMDIYFGRPPSINRSRSESASPGKINHHSSKRSRSKKFVWQEKSGFTIQSVEYDTGIPMLLEIFRRLPEATVIIDNILSSGWLSNDNNEKSNPQYQSSQRGTLSPTVTPPTRSFSNFDLPRRPRSVSQDEVKSEISEEKKSEVLSSPDLRTDSRAGSVTGTMPMSKTLKENERTRLFYEQTFEILVRISAENAIANEHWAETIRSLLFDFQCMMLLRFQHFTQIAREVDQARLDRENEITEKPSDLIIDGDDNWLMQDSSVPPAISEFWRVHRSRSNQQSSSAAASMKKPPISSSYPILARDILHDRVMRYVSIVFENFRNLIESYMQNEKKISEDGSTQIDLPMLLKCLFCCDKSKDDQKSLDLSNNALLSQARHLKVFCQNLIIPLLTSLLALFGGQTTIPTDDSVIGSGKSNSKSNKNSSSKLSKSKKTPALLILKMIDLFQDCISELFQLSDALLCECKRFSLSGILPCEFDESESNTMIVESVHPYSKGKTIQKIVAIPQAVSLTLEFDDQCCTDTMEDFLQVFIPSSNIHHNGEFNPNSNGSFVRVLGPIGGGATEWPIGRKIEVPGDCAVIHFTSNSTAPVVGPDPNSSSMFGYRIRVSGRVKSNLLSKHLGWLEMVNAQIAQMLANLSRHLIDIGGVSSDIDAAAKTGRSRSVSVGIGNGQGLMSFVSLSEYECLFSGGMNFDSTLTNQFIPEGDEFKQSSKKDEFQVLSDMIEFCRIGLNKSKLYGYELKVLAQKLNDSVIRMSESNLLILAAPLIQELNIAVFAAIVRHIGAGPILMETLEKIRGMDIPRSESSVSMSVESSQSTGVSSYTRLIPSPQAAILLKDSDVPKPLFILWKRAHLAVTQSLVLCETEEQCEQVFNKMRMKCQFLLRVNPAHSELRGCFPPESMDLAAQFGRGAAYFGEDQTPQGDSVLVDWICDQCAHLNDKFQRKCQICRTINPARESPSTSVNATVTKTSASIISASESRICHSSSMPSHLSQTGMSIVQKTQVNRTLMKHNTPKQPKQKKYPSTTISPIITSAAATIAAVAGKTTGASTPRRAAEDLIFERFGFVAKDFPSFKLHNSFKHLVNLQALTESISIEQKKSNTHGTELAKPDTNIVSYLLRQINQFFSVDFDSKFLKHLELSLKVESSMGILRMRGLSLISQCIRNINHMDSLNIIMKMLSDLMTITQYNITDSIIPVKLKDTIQNNMENSVGFRHFLSNVEFSGSRIIRSILDTNHQLIDTVIHHINDHDSSESPESFYQCSTLVDLLLQLISTCIHTNDLRYINDNRIPEFLHSMWTSSTCNTHEDSHHSISTWSIKNRFNSWLTHRILLYSMCFPMYSPLPTVLLNDGNSVLDMDKHVTFSNYSNSSMESNKGNWNVDTTTKTKKEQMTLHMKKNQERSSRRKLLLFSCRVPHKESLRQSLSILSGEFEALLQCEEEEMKYVDETAEGSSEKIKSDNMNNNKPDLMSLFESILSTKEQLILNEVSGSSDNLLGKNNKPAAAAQWSCPRCTLLNNANVEVCEACEMGTRAEAKVETTDVSDTFISMFWECSQCRASNDVSDLDCNICHALNQTVDAMTEDQQESEHSSNLKKDNDVTHQNSLEMFATNSLGKCDASFLRQYPSLTTSSSLSSSPNKCSKDTLMTTRVFSIDQLLWTILRCCPSQFFRSVICEDVNFVRNLIRIVVSPTLSEMSSDTRPSSIKVINVPITHSTQILSIKILSWLLNEMTPKFVFDRKCFMSLNQFICEVFLRIGRTECRTFDQLPSNVFLKHNSLNEDAVSLSLVHLVRVLLSSSAWVTKLEKLVVHTLSVPMKRMTNHFQSMEDGSGATGSSHHSSGVEQSSKPSQISDGAQRIDDDDMKTSQMSITVDSPQMSEKQRSISLPTLTTLNGQVIKSKSMSRGSSVICSDDDLDESDFHSTGDMRHLDLTGSTISASSSQSSTNMHNESLVPTKNLCSKPNVSSLATSNPTVIDAGKKPLRPLSKEQRQLSIRRVFGVLSVLGEMTCEIHEGCRVLITNVRKKSRHLGTVASLVLDPIDNSLASLTVVTDDGVSSVFDLSEGTHEIQSVDDVPFDPLKLENPKNLLTCLKQYLFDTTEIIQHTPRNTQSKKSNRDASAAAAECNNDNQNDRNENEIENVEQSDQHQPEQQAVVVSDTELVAVKLQRGVLAAFRSFVSSKDLIKLFSHRNLDIPRALLNIAFADQVAFHPLSNLQVVPDIRLGSDSYKQFVSRLNQIFQQTCNLTMSTKHGIAGGFDSGGGGTVSYLRWRQKLRAGDIIDAKDKMGNWFESEILSIEGGRLKVHYKEWSSKWDEWLALTSKRIAPRGTFTDGSFKNRGFVALTPKQSRRIDILSRDPMINMRTILQSLVNFRAYQPCLSDSVQQLLKLPKSPLIHPVQSRGQINNGKSNHHSSSMMPNYGRNSNNNRLNQQQPSEGSEMSSDNQVELEPRDAEHQFQNALTRIENLISTHHAAIHQRTDVTSIERLMEDRRLQDFVRQAFQNSFMRAQQLGVQSQIPLLPTAMPPLTPPRPPPLVPNQPSNQRSQSNPHSSANLQPSGTLSRAMQANDPALPVSRSMRWSQIQARQQRFVQHQQESREQLARHDRSQPDSVELEREEDSDMRPSEDPSERTEQSVASASQASSNESQSTEALSLPDHLETADLTASRVRPSRSASSVPDSSTSDMTESSAGTDSMSPMSAIHATFSSVLRENLICSHQTGQPQLFSKSTNELAFPMPDHLFRAARIPGEGNNKPKQQNVELIDILGRRKPESKQHWKANEEELFKDVRQNNLQPGFSVSLPRKNSVSLWKEIKGNMDNVKSSVNAPKSPGNSAQIGSVNDSDSEESFPLNGCSFFLRFKVMNGSKHTPSKLDTGELNIPDWIRICFISNSNPNIPFCSDDEYLPRNDDEYMECAISVTDGCIELFGAPVTAEPILIPISDELCGSSKKKSMNRSSPNKDGFDPTTNHESRSRSQSSADTEDGSEQVWVAGPLRAVNSVSPNNRRGSVSNNESNNISSSQNRRRINSNASADDVSERIEDDEESVSEPSSSVDQTESGITNAWMMVTIGDNKVGCMYATENGNPTGNVSMCALDTSLLLNETCKAITFDLNWPNPDQTNDNNNNNNNSMNVTRNNKPDIIPDFMVSHFMVWTNLTLDLDVFDAIAKITSDKPYPPIQRCFWKSLEMCIKEQSQKKNNMELLLSKKKTKSQPSLMNLVKNQILIKDSMNLTNKKRTMELDNIDQKNQTILLNHGDFTIVNIDCENQTTIVDEEGRRNNNTSPLHSGGMINDNDIGNNINGSGSSGPSSVLRSGVRSSTEIGEDEEEKSVMSINDDSLFDMPETPDIPEPSRKNHNKTLIPKRPILKCLSLSMSFSIPCEITAPFAILFLPDNLASFILDRQLSSSISDSTHDDDDFSNPPQLNHTSQSIDDSYVCSDWQRRKAEKQRSKRSNSLSPRRDRKINKHSRIRDVDAASETLVPTQNSKMKDDIFQTSHHCWLCVWVDTMGYLWVCDQRLNQVKLNANEMHGLHFEYSLMPSSSEKTGSTDHHCFIKLFVNGLLVLSLTEFGSYSRSTTHSNDYRCSTEDTSSHLPSPPKIKKNSRSPIKAIRHSKWQRRVFTLISPVNCCLIGITADVIQNMFSKDRSITGLNPTGSFNNNSTRSRTLDIYKLDIQMLDEYQSSNVDQRLNEKGQMSSLMIRSSISSHLLKGLGLSISLPFSHKEKALNKLIYPDSDANETSDSLDPIDVVSQLSGALYSRQALNKAAEDPASGAQPSTQNIKDCPLKRIGIFISAVTGWSVSSLVDIMRQTGFESKNPLSWSLLVERMVQISTLTNSTRSFISLVNGEEKKHEISEYSTKLGRSHEDLTSSFEQRLQTRLTFLRDSNSKQDNLLSNVCSAQVYNSCEPLRQQDKERISFLSEAKLNEVTVLPKFRNTLSSKVTLNGNSDDNKEEEEKKEEQEFKEDPCSEQKSESTVVSNNGLSVTVASQPTGVTRNLYNEVSVEMEKTLGSFYSRQILLGCLDEYSEINMRFYNLQPSLKLEEWFNEAELKRLIRAVYSYDSVKNVKKLQRSLQVSIIRETTRLGQSSGSAISPSTSGNIKAAVIGRVTSVLWTEIIQGLLIFSHSNSADKCKINQFGSPADSEQATAQAKYAFFCLQIFTNAAHNFEAVWSLLYRRTYGVLDTRVSPRIKAKNRMLRALRRTVFNETLMRLSMDALLSAADTEFCMKIAVLIGEMVVLYPKPSRSEEILSHLNCIDQSTQNEQKSMKDQGNSQTSSQSGVKAKEEGNGDVNSKRREKCSFNVQSDYIPPLRIPYVDCLCSALESIVDRNYFDSNDGFSDPKTWLYPDYLTALVELAVTLAVTNYYPATRPWYRPNDYARTSEERAHTKSSLYGRQWFQKMVLGSTMMQWFSLNPELQTARNLKLMAPKTYLCLVREIQQWVSIKKHMQKSSEEKESDEQKYQESSPKRASMSQVAFSNFFEIFSSSIQDSNVSRCLHKIVHCLQCNKLGSDKVSVKPSVFADLSAALKNLLPVFVQTDEQCRISKLTKDILSRLTHLLKWHSDRWSGAIGSTSSFSSVSSQSESTANGPDSWLIRAETKLLADKLNHWGCVLRRFLFGKSGGHRDRLVIDRLLNEKQRHPQLSDAVLTNVLDEHISQGISDIQEQVKLELQRAANDESNDNLGEQARLHTKTKDFFEHLNFDGFRVDDKTLLWGKLGRAEPLALAVRIQLIWKLNQALEDCLPMLDLSLPLLRRSRCSFSGGCTRRALGKALCADKLRTLDEEIIARRRAENGVSPSFNGFAHSLQGNSQNSLSKRKDDGHEFDSESVGNGIWSVNCSVSGLYCEQGRKLAVRSLWQPTWENRVSITRDGTNTEPAFQIDRFRCISSDEREYTMFIECIKQLDAYKPNMFRLDRHQRGWKVVFYNEHSVDAGGPYRESLQWMCNELQSVPYQFPGLLIQTPNARSETGVNQDRWLPNPQLCNSRRGSGDVAAKHTQMFQFLGKLMGLAIRTKNLLDLNLAPLVWKYLCGTPISEKDIMAVDCGAFSVFEDIDPILRGLGSLIFQRRGCQQTSSLSRLPHSKSGVLLRKDPDCSSQRSMSDGKSDIGTFSSTASSSSSTLMFVDGYSTDSHSSSELSSITLRNPLLSGRSDTSRKHSFFAAISNESELEEVKTQLSILEEILIRNGIKFEGIGMDGQIRPLLAGGSDIPVTCQNLLDYRTAYSYFRVHELDGALECIRRGLATVVPIEQLNLFKWNVLERLVCGAREFDVDLLEQMTVYSGCKATDRHIQMFWRMMREKMSDEQRSKLLVFVWGRSRLPSNKQDFDRKMKICKLEYRHSTPADHLLPVAHTCFFQLDLPAYSTIDIMFHKVSYAIANCGSIDTDE